MDPQDRLSKTALLLQKAKEEGRTVLCADCKQTKPWIGYRVCVVCRDKRRKARKTGFCHRCMKDLAEDGMTMCRRCRERRRNTRHDLRAEVLRHYGARCACCGEQNPVFLAIDHVDGGGNQHHIGASRAAGMPLCRWLKKSGFPEGYQVLCHNCNFGKHFNGGVCPHQGLQSK